MATTTKRNYKGHNKPKPTYSAYIPSMISVKIHLKMSEVGDSTRMNLERKIVQRTEGKCIPEGFVRPDSVELVTYSSGVIKMNLVEFQVVYKCLICNPVEGLEIECTTKTITKAGIHAEVVTQLRNGVCIPMKIFVARDHNYANRTFGNVKENDTINVRIIGKRFELNDPYIVAIAMLADKEQHRSTINPSKHAKQRITVMDDVDQNIEDEDEYVEPEQQQEENEEENEDETEDETEEKENPEIEAPISIPTVNQSSPEKEEGEIDE